MFFSIHLSLAVITSLPATELICGVPGSPGGSFCSPSPLRGCEALTSEGGVALCCTGHFLQCSMLYSTSGSFLFLFLLVMQGEVREKKQPGSFWNALPDLRLVLVTVAELCKNLMSDERWGYRNRYSQNRGGFACSMNSACIALSEIR